MKKIIGIATFSLFAALAPTAHASVTIFSNMSTDPSAADYAYTPDSSGYVNIFGVEWTQAVNYGTAGIHSKGSAWAYSFTVNTGYDIPLESVVLPIYKAPDGAAPNLVVKLLGDNGNALPNTSNVIETLATNPVIAENDETFLHLTSALQPVLQNGHTYWIAVEPDHISKTDSSADASYGWVQNFVGTTFGYTINQYNDSLAGGAGDWQGYFNQPRSDFLSPAMQIIGVGAPEPASLAVMGAALPLLLRRRK